MSSKKLLIVSLIAILAIACTKKTEKQAKAEQIVTEWVGKTIQLSPDIPLSVYGKDTVLPDFGATPYKILLYVDSSGCTTCKMKMYEWRELIAEADSLLNEKLTFVFYFQPKNTKDLMFLLRRDRFNYPVYIDSNSSLMHLNKLPEDPAFQCFLLDAQNKVLSIGNPALNPGVWKLYKKIMTGEIEVDKNNTTVEQIQDVIELSDIKKGETHKLQFSLKNTGNTALVISDIKTSCGCTTASWQKIPVEPGKTTPINAEINIKELGFFQKTVSVYCNTVNSPVIYTIKGNTVND